ncbi:MAG: hypothetical protein H7145_12620 [Akkermansiaceae bacterium]|nr:hypothetical protein [Armatimonadota bacterium]
MLKRTLFPILAFLLIVGTVLCAVRPSGAGAWYCEGKQCGITAWLCCCDESSGRDGNCDAPVVATRGDSAALCDTGCACTMVITDDTDCDHTIPVLAPIQSPIALAVLPAMVAPYIPPTIVTPAPQQVGSRGPPLRRSTHTYASLRAPPAA